MRDGDVLKSSGSEFQHRVTSNRGGSLLELWFRLSVAGRSFERCWTSVKRVPQSVQCLGHKQTTFILHSEGTRSQWSLSFRNGVMWSYFHCRKWFWLRSQEHINANHLAGWDASKKTVAIVHSDHHKAVGQLDGHRCRNWTSNFSNPSKLIWFFDGCLKYLQCLSVSSISRVL